MQQKQRHQQQQPERVKAVGGMNAIESHATARGHVPRRGHEIGGIVRYAYQKMTNVALPCELQAEKRRARKYQHGGRECRTILRRTLRIDHLTKHFALALRQ
ncbi:MAG TPA: hypothetical protein VN925_00135 [Steroidobacteraceae bacterium]|nr:hypothetical protein [Steroidobacteraceae bacterium]